jgi:hypothetical protein
MEPVVDDVDDGLASQINSLVLAQIAVETQVGDDTEAAGTLRYRMNAAEAASGTGDGKVLISSADTTKNYLGQKILAGDNITLTSGSPGGDETLTIASTGGGGSTVKVSATDTTADYLGDKLLAGDGITLASGSPGGNETLAISTTYSGVSITQAVLTADFTITGTAGWGTYSEPSSPTWNEIDNGSGDAVEVTINTTTVNETVLINVTGYGIGLAAADHVHWYGLKIDGTVEYWTYGGYPATEHPCNIAINKPWTFASAGSHTIKLVGTRHSANQNVRVVGSTNIPENPATITVFQYR